MEEGGMRGSGVEWRNVECSRVRKVKHRIA